MNYDIIFNEIFKDYKDINEFKKNLNFLSTCSFSANSYEGIRKTIYDLMRIIPKTNIKTKPEKFLNRRLYRSRFNINENTNLVESYSYPPTGKAPVGRGNMKGESVFYCTDHPTASVLESNPKIGDVGFISLWRPIALIPLNVGVYFPKSMSFKNTHNTIVKEFYQKIHYNKFYGYEEHILALIDFIAERYINEEHPYPLTSFISKENLSIGQKNHFIIYPSSKSYNYYTNYAFNTKVVDYLIQFEKVIAIKIKSLSQTLKFDYMKVGYSEDSINIKWRTPTEQDKRDFYLNPQYKVEDGKLILY